MATLKIVHYRSKTYSDKTSPILLRLTIDRKPKYFGFADNYKCFAGQWDKRNNKFNHKYPNYDEINVKLSEAVTKAEKIIRDLNDKNNNEFSFDEFAEQFNKKSSKLFLFEYFDQVIDRFNQAGKVGNSGCYADVKRQFQYFFDNDIEISKITLKHLNLYVERCQAKKQKDTTISYRLRTLRALIYKARKEEGLENNPFQKFDWGQFNLETEKRAITKEEILKIHNLKLEPGQPGFDTRNIFMFSYFCYGLNYGDLAKLEPENIIVNGEHKTLKYYRSKTRKLFEIGLNDMSLEILNYYLNSNFGNKYIFPILNPEIHKTPIQIKTRIQTALKKFNSEIRIIAESLGITAHLTSYVARHTFATVLKKSNVETAIISEMMGHSSESVTQTYLKGFDNSTKTNAAKNLL